ncbi:hypothetical protein AvCA_27430 [Azotobacter vinelandii CA]|uniref:Uncharacterized protein n=2 Tax=Azotobacter vinelandii TaxID=354 RepID=C1DKR5_AZOVD|nr:hypothetical protein Avin_27430 [Azotobacter vinelandii DJ]AGK16559.1 hypothetical protein AvCA_27430 [Azotobacter vinelandii CA]AGK20845.1 hypothetical protein AvCA6_27430 [Azotobacter vinelandii CA6]
MAGRLGFRWWDAVPGWRARACPGPDEGQLWGRVDLRRWPWHAFTRDRARTGFHRHWRAMRACMRVLIGFA